MDFIQEILSANIKIDFIIISLVIAGGYFQKSYWTSEKPRQALKTLFVGTVFSCHILRLNYGLFKI
jgi:hypothetical protein